MKLPKLRESSSEDARPLASGGANTLDEQAAAKLLERYAVAAPDDLTVERVWQRLANPAPSSIQSRPAVAVGPVAFGFLASAVLACVVLLGLILLRGTVRPARPPAMVATQASRSAELSVARGGVFFSRPAERWQPALDGQALAERQLLRTDPSGRALLDLPGVASLLLAPGTDFGLERLNAGTFLRLSRGSVIARVSKRSPGDPFVILTDRFSVKVVGTLFQVDQDASDRTVVEVREGTVEVASADGQVWRVRAGQRWVSSQPSQLGVSTIPDPVKTLLEDGLLGASSVDLRREFEALESVPAVTAASEASRMAQALAVDPASPGLSTIRDRTARELKGKSALGASHEPAEEYPQPQVASPDLTRSARQTRALIPPPVVLAEREPTKLSESSSREQLPPSPGPSGTGDGAYARGMALERGGQFQAAATELARAERDDPRNADLALYALGRLYQDRLSNPQGALSAFERYRSSYPQGVLSQEVDLAVLEVEAQLGDHKEALAESSRFLASHPASERTDEVRRLRGDLLREAGNCRAALDAYSEIAAPAFAEAALYGTARCQQELGNRPAAVEALRAYQKRFPAGVHRDEVAKELANASAKHF